MSSFADPRRSETYEVVLLRHGETVGYDGDRGLTAGGLEQARKCGAILASELRAGTTVRMPHARSARGSATAVAVRSALLDTLGDSHEVAVSALTPNPWFDNLRVSVDGAVMDAADAVVERLSLDGHRLPDWAREYDRFDSDYGPAAPAVDRSTTGCTTRRSTSSRHRWRPIGSTPHRIGEEPAELGRSTARRRRYALLTDACVRRIGDRQ